MASKSKPHHHLPVFDENPQIRNKLVFNQGSNFFRQRIILSLLSSRPVKISNIRSNSDDLVVGLKPYEVSFIHLVSEISNGSKIKISETGTEVTCIPGLLTGGAVEFKADPAKSLSYYLEPILFLAPFCKKPLELTIRGRLQNDTSGYNSVYKLKHAALPIMELFGLEPEIQVTSRKYDDSVVKFTCGVKKQLLTLRNQVNDDCGKVKKIRGLTYGFRVSPQMLNRVVTAAKGFFIPFLSDVYITTDQIKGSKSKIPGYGVVLYATTTKNITYAADAFIGRDGDENPTSLASTGHPSVEGRGEKRRFKLFEDGDDAEDEEETDKKKRFESNIDNVVINIPLLTSKPGSIEGPEELGTHVAKLLLKEMSSQSCVDSVFQWLVLGFMALGPKNVSSVIMGPLTPFTIQYLRDLKTFFGITFKVEEHKLGDGQQEEDEDDEDESKAGLHKLSCLGTGYINLNKTLI